MNKEEIANAFYDWVHEQLDGHAVAPEMKNMGLKVFAAGCAFGYKKAKEENPTTEQGVNDGG